MKRQQYKKVKVSVKRDVTNEEEKKCLDSAEVDSIFGQFIAAMKSATIELNSKKETEDPKDAEGDELNLRIFR